jgi:hypothetical protein
VIGTVFKTVGRRLALLVDSISTAFRHFSPASRILMRAG